MVGADLLFVPCARCGHLGINHEKGTCRGYECTCSGFVPGTEEAAIEHS